MGNTESFDIAGFTDVYSRLGKRLSSGEIFVLSGARLEGDQLVWPLNPVNPVNLDGAWTKPTPAMFAAFVELWQHPERIQRFAKKWGRLGMDEQGRLTDGPVQDASNEKYSEPIKTWCYFSRRVFSALSIAANLEQGKPGSADDWAALSPLHEWIHENLRISLRSQPFALGLWAKRGFEGLAHFSIEDQRMILPSEVTLWLKFSGLGFALIPVDNGRRWDFRVDFSARLMAAIALQLALTVSRTNTLFTCSGCSKPYVRQGKKPRSGQLNFCPECGRTASTRQSDERRRERVQQARQLHADGLTVHEIAKQLNTKRVATVRRWIEKGK